LAATLCTDEVASGISKDQGIFMHGPTFMGNPMACACALASIELLEQSDWRGQIASIEEQLRNELTLCSKEDAVNDVRVLGAIGVVEMQEPVDISTAQAFFVEQGVWIRPFGKLVYIMPPYVIESDDLTKLTNAIAAFTQR
ncbi:MAG: aminotransferase class III-fold pyridoxal phosphate-dependent enzyme, partial [Pseudomonadales bacterium]